jgi:hypothetical protein
LFARNGQNKFKKLFGFVRHPLKILTDDEQSPKAFLN